MNDPDPRDRPTGDALGGWHQPDREEQWDQHRGQYFRVFDLNQLASERTDDDE